MKKYIYLGLWALTLLGGAMFYNLAPSNWWYIIGFTLGCFSPLLLTMYDIEKEKEKEGK